MFQKFSGDSRLLPWFTYIVKYIERRICCIFLQTAVTPVSVHIKNASKNIGFGLRSIRKSFLTRMWANAQRDGRPAAYRWRPLLNATKFDWRPLLECRAVTLPIIGERKTWTQIEFCTCKIPSGGKSPRKCIYSVPAQETAKHRTKFGWLPLSDVAAVTKPRRETRWNLLGCPKLANRSQLLVDRNLSYCEDMWKRHCCLIFFFDCRHVP